MLCFLLSVEGVETTFTGMVMEEARVAFFKVDVQCYLTVIMHSLSNRQTTTLLVTICDAVHDT